MTYEEYLKLNEQFENAKSKVSIKIKHSFLDDYEFDIAYFRYNDDLYRSSDYYPYCPDEFVALKQFGLLSEDFLEEDYKTAKKIFDILKKNLTEEEIKQLSDDERKNIDIDIKYFSEVLGHNPDNTKDLKSSLHFPLSIKDIIGCSEYRFYSLEENNIVSENFDPKGFFDYTYVQNKKILAPKTKDFNETVIKYASITINDKEKGVHTVYTIGGNSSFTDFYFTEEQMNKKFDELSKAVEEYRNKSLETLNFAKEYLVRLSESNADNKEEYMKKLVKMINEKDFHGLNCWKYGRYSKEAYDLSDRLLVNNDVVLDRSETL